MANRRMFSSEVVCTDKFLDMPSSSQALYFQFGMKADDDGFISAPRQIARMANASDDDLRILLSKGYLIPFDSGVLVIKDWHVNNYLRKDRYTETRYLGEKSMLDVVNSEYVLSKKTDTTSCTPCGIPSDNHSVTHTDTQERIGKDRVVKDRVVKNLHPVADTYFDDPELNQLFLDFIDSRKKMRRPMTERAIQLSVSKLKKLSALPFGDPEEFCVEDAKKIIENSIVNGWQSFYPLKPEHQKEAVVSGRKTSSFDEWMNA